MKSLLSLQSLLLMSTVMLSPTLAAAQDTTGTPAPAADEADAGDEIIVRGAFIPEPQRATSQVASFLSAEDLARTGDDTAALALTRLSGLSVVGGRFAFVRGLGDRYSSALLNGSPLPSPEPLRRTVPLDLFPSNILDGAAVQKTFSANYPGEFGGGIIDLKTVRRPNEPFLNLKGSIGINSETTLFEGIFVRGSDTDWTGFDDGLRDIPDALQSALDSSAPILSLTDAEVEAIGESLVNSPLTVIQNGDLGPNFQGSIEAGTVFDKGDVEIGLVGVLGYDQSWRTERATRNFQQAGIVGTELQSVETTLDVTTNALGTLSFGWGGNEVQSTLFYVHAGSKETQIDQGRNFNAPGTGIIFDESSGWYERELAMLQFSGEHAWGDFELNWRGAVAQSTREAPYERDLRRIEDTEGTPLYSQANNYNIRFSDLQDDIISGGFDGHYNFLLFGTRDATISGGVDYAGTERRYDFFAFRFAGGNSLPLDVQQARPDFLFSPDNIDPTRFVFLETPTVNDSYEAELTVNAAFAQADFELTPFIRSTLGVRFEEAEQIVGTFDRFGNVGASTVLENEYFLPAATFTWNFANDLQLRLGYSETIARPQFRELARSSFFDPESDRLYRGNNGLLDTELTNYDARLEYYFGRNQFITLAGFYKELLNPVEEIQFSTSTFEFETTFINSPEATLYGGEFEYRTRFQMPIDHPFFAERNWLFSTNYTYTFSEVTADEGQQVFNPISGSLADASLFSLDGSVLQGTPEHILNAQFGWEDEDDQLTLLVGWVDNRVLQRGINLPGAELPDVVEDPGVNVDLVFRQDIELGGHDFTLGISGRNLLDEQHVEFQESDDAGVTDFNTYDRGRSLSFSVTAKF